MAKKLEIRIPATLSRLTKKVDRTWSVGFNTNELSDEEVFILNRIFLGYGELVFIVDDED